jgi:hypothetical protein
MIWLSWYSKLDYFIYFHCHCHYLEKYYRIIIYVHQLITREIFGFMITQTLYKQKKNYLQKTSES